MVVHRGSMRFDALGGASSSATNFTEAAKNSRSTLEKSPEREYQRTKLQQSQAN